MSKFLMLITLLLISLSFTSCSYKELEDSLRSTQGEEEEYVNTNEKPEASIEGEGQASTTSSDLGVIMNIGDTFITTAPGPDKTEEVSYTLNEVDIISNLNDTVLNYDNFYQSGFWNEDGSLLNEGEELYLIVADLTITNISKPADELYIACFAGTEYGLFEDPSGPIVEELVYSEFREESLGEKAAYELNIEVGESVTGKVAWLVTQTNLEGDIFYIMNGESGNDRMSYFLLNP